VNGLRKRGSSCGHVPQSGLAQHPAVRQLLAAHSALWHRMAAGGQASSTSVLLSLGLLEERLLLQVLQRLTPHVAKLSARELVNLMHNVAKGWHKQGQQQLDQQRNAFFAAASDQVAQLATGGRLNGQDISNAVYACALVRHGDEEMCSSIVQAAISSLATFNAQNLSNLLWGLAKLVDADMVPVPVVAEQLCSRLAAAAKSRIREFNAQDISNTIWAWAKLKKAGLPVQLDVQMCLGLAEEAIAKAGSFQPQALSNTLWAWAVLARGDNGLPGAHHKLVEQLFGTLTAAAMQLLPQLSSQEVANLMHAHATCSRFCTQQLYQQLGAAMQGKLAGASVQAICNAAWAIAVAGSQGTCTLDSAAGFWAAAATELQQRYARQPSSFSSEALGQLYQVQRVAQLLGAGRHCFGLPAGLAAAAERAMKQGAQNIQTTSRFQAGVVRTAQQLLHSERGAAPALFPELVDPRYLSPIDCALPWEGCPVALQADGPMHFLLDGRGQPCSQDGSTQLRDTTLRRLGWLVVVVPVHEWAKLAGAADKEAYLRRQLGAAVARVPAEWHSRPEVMESLQVLQNALAGGSVVLRHCLGCAVLLSAVRCEGRMCLRCFYLRRGQAASSAMHS
jgi:hypothetical protein